MGLLLDTGNDDLMIEVRSESVYLNDAFHLNDAHTEDESLQHKQHLYLYKLDPQGLSGQVEVTKEWLGWLLDYWTPERRRKHGI